MNQQITSSTWTTTAAIRAAGESLSRSGALLPPDRSEELVQWRGEIFTRCFGVVGTVSGPGNIRELENAVVRGTAVCDGTIRVKDLPERLQNYRGEAPQESPESLELSLAPEEWIPLAAIQGRYVTKVLAHTGGNKQAARVCWK